jgi:peptide/nickel transport system substrate-binding protein
LSAENFAALERTASRDGYHLEDLGAGLQFNFLFFNLNDLPDELSKITDKQTWFRDTAFRQAVSAAIDRQALARLVYRGRATPIWTHVSPGNRPWFHPGIPRPERSLERARRLLSTAGFSWHEERLVDPEGRPVSFTIVTNSTNSERVQMMTVAQQDLSELGMEVQVVPLEFQALLDRVLGSHDYEACILGLGGGDVDPNPLMSVLSSAGGSHLWRPGQSEPATTWEAEIDRLMNEQTTEMNFAARKALYDRVQELMAEQLPMIPLVSPNILVGAKASLGNFRPVILDHHTLWNVEELFWE